MSSEVTENILYMKLLHELKAAFPAVSDDIVRQCISQFDKDKNRCLEFLSQETERIRHGHYGRYNQERKFSLQGISNRSLIGSRGYHPTGKESVTSISSLATSFSSLVTSESASTFQSYDESESQSRRSLTLPFHLNLPPRKCQKTISSHNDSSQLYSSSHHDASSSQFSTSTTKDSTLQDLTSGYATSHTSRSNDSIPTVILTPDSPPLECRTLYHPNDDFDDLIMFGHAKSLTATCLDIDLSPTNEDDEDNDDICSLRTTTVSQGVINLMSRGSPLSTTDFTTIQQDTISLSSSRSSCSSSSCSSSSSSSCKSPRKCRRSTKTMIFSTRPNNDESTHRDPTVTSSCNENPFRKVFVRRKQFYQNIERERGEQAADENSSSKLIWRRRLCSLCSTSSDPRRQCPGREKTDKNANRLTLNANIQPFAPFVIHHDMNSKTGGTLMLCQPSDSNCIANDNFYGEANNNNNNVKNNSLLLKPCVSGLELSPDGREVRYATSTINSEDGVESHLEVSMNKDGSVITTRHKRLGTPTEVSNNSVLHVQYGEGGKVLNISQSQHLSPSPRATQKSPQNVTRSPLLPPRQRPNSAYCTAQFPFTTPCSHLGTLRYNSLPNLNGRIRGPPIYESDLAGSSPWLYNTHPADEEKRMAYTRALLSHQMEQCMKLERELSLTRHEVQVVQNDVIELEKKITINQLLSEGKISAEIIEKEITDLRQACDSMADEVTKLTKGTVPLGETSIEFYESLPTTLEHEVSCPKYDVQRGGSRHDMARRPTPSNEAVSSGGLVEEKQWSCSECTFLNHPALQTCEECDMPRIVIDGEEPSKGLFNVIQSVS